MSADDFPELRKFERILAGLAPFMAGAVGKGRGFSPTWEPEFEATLARLFQGSEPALAAAAGAYVRFALDVVRLQKRFDREQRYPARSYAEVAAAVYHDAEHMATRYLPGILMSQYLWPNRYRQFEFFRREFLPRLAGQAAPTFADVGVGTGFYSRQVLASHPRAQGVGFDISEHSLAYTVRHVGAFGWGNRWEARRQDVVATTPSEGFDAVFSLEVLEHLEDPRAFLRALRRMLAPGGTAFVSAAITAPEEDHIYLYRSSREVAEQLEAEGFRVLASQEDAAYPSRAGEPVPRLGAFLCS